MIGWSNGAALGSTSSGPSVAVVGATGATGSAVGVEVGVEAGAPDAMVTGSAVGVKAGALGSKLTGGGVVTGSVTGPVVGSCVASSTRHGYSAARVKILCWLGFPYVSHRYRTAAVFLVWGYVVLRRVCALSTFRWNLIGRKLG